MTLLSEILPEIRSRMEALRSPPVKLVIAHSYLEGVVRAPQDPIAAAHYFWLAIKGKRRGFLLFQEKFLLSKKTLFLSACEQLSAASPLKDISDPERDYAGW